MYMLPGFGRLVKSRSKQSMVLLPLFISYSLPLYTKYNVNYGYEKYTGINISNLLNNCNNYTKQ